MELFRQVFGIFSVFGLLAAALWWLRRRNALVFRGLRRAKRGARRMVLVERMALTPHHSLHLVRAGGRELLIGLHSAGCTLVDSWPRQELEQEEP